MKISDFIKTNYFIKKKIANAYRNNNRRHEFHSFQDIRKVLILFNMEDWTYIDRIIRDLQDKGKTVFGWTLKPKHEENAPILPQNVRMIDPAKDLSWQQLPAGHVTGEFKNMEYDTLFDLTTKTRYYMTYLLMLNDSKLSVGIKEIEEKMYDCIILKEEDKDLYETYEQIKFYLDNMFGSVNNS